MYKKNRHTKKSAFTLTELVMTLGIIAVMMAILLPSTDSLKTETKQTSITKNKDTLTGIVGMKLTRLRSQGLGGDILLTELMKDLETEPTLTSMINPFDTSKKGIGLIKGDTYDNTNKAAYIFTSPPKENTLPKGTAFVVVKPDQLVAEGLPDIEINPGTVGSGTGGTSGEGGGTGGSSVIDTSGKYPPSIINDATIFTDTWSTTGTSIYKARNGKYYYTGYPLTTGYIAPITTPVEITDIDTKSILDIKVLSNILFITFKDNTTRIYNPSNYTNPSNTSGTSGYNTISYNPSIIQNKGATTFVITTSGELYIQSKTMYTDIPTIKSEYGMHKVDITDVKDVVDVDSTIYILKNDGTIWGYAQSDVRYLGLPYDTTKVKKLLETPMSNIESIDKSAVYPKFKGNNVLYGYFTTLHAIPYITQKPTSEPLGYLQKYQLEPDIIDYRVRPYVYSSTNCSATYSITYDGTYITLPTNNSASEWLGLPSNVAGTYKIPIENIKDINISIPERTTIITTDGLLYVSGRTHGMNLSSSNPIKLFARIPITNVDSIISDTSNYVIVKKKDNTYWVGTSSTYTLLPLGNDITKVCSISYDITKDKLTTTIIRENGTAWYIDGDTKKQLIPFDY